MCRYDGGTMRNLSVRHSMRFFAGCSIASLMLLAVLPFLMHAGFEGSIASAAISVSGGAAGSTGTGSSGSTGGSASLSSQSQPTQGGGYTSSASSISDDKHANGYSAPASGSSATVGASGNTGGTASLSSTFSGSTGSANGNNGSTASLSSLSNGGSNSAGANGYVQPSTPSTLSNSTFSSNAVANIASYFNVSDKNLFVTSLVAPVVNAFSSIFTTQSSNNSNGYGGYIPGGTSIPSSVTGSRSSLGQTVTTYTSTGQAVTTYTNSGSGSSIQSSTGFSGSESSITGTAPSQLGLADSIAQGIGSFLNWIGPQSNTVPATVVNSSGSPNDRGSIIISNPMVPRTSGTGASATCVPGDCQAAVQNVQASTPAANQTVTGTDVTNTSSGGAAINSSGSPDERAPLPDASNILQRVATFVKQVQQANAIPATTNTQAGSGVTSGTQAQQSSSNAGSSAITDDKHSNGYSAAPASAGTNANSAGTVTAGSQASVVIDDSKQANGYSGGSSASFASNQISNGVAAIGQYLGSALSYVNNVIGGAQAKAPTVVIDDSKQANGYSGSRAQPTPNTITVGGYAQGGTSPGVQTSVSVAGTSGASLSAKQVLAEGGIDISKLSTAGQADAVKTFTPATLQKMSDILNDTNLSATQKDGYLSSLLNPNLDSQIETALPKDSTGSIDLNKLAQNVDQMKKDMAAVGTNAGTKLTVTSPSTVGTEISGVQTQAQQPAIDATNGGWNTLVKTVSSGVQAISAWAAPYINSGAAQTPAQTNVTDVLNQGVDENLAPVLSTGPDQTVVQQVQTSASPTDQLRNLSQNVPKLGITSNQIAKLQQDIKDSGYTEQQIYKMTLAQAKALNPNLNADLSQLFTQSNVTAALGCSGLDCLKAAKPILTAQGNPNTTVGQLFTTISVTLGVTPVKTVTTNKTVTLPNSGELTVTQSNAVTASQNDSTVAHPSGSALGSVDTSPAGSFGWLTNTIGRIFTKSGAGVIVSSDTNTNPSAQVAQQGSNTGDSSNNVSNDNSLLSGTSFSDIAVTLGVPKPTADLITNTTKVAAQAVQLVGGSVLPSSEQVKVVVSAYKGFIDTYPIAGSIANSINTLNPIAFMIGGSAADAKATQVAVAKVYAQAATQYGDLFAGPTDGPGIANLITAQVKYENPWYDSRNSGTGAVGIAQFIPSTWETQFKTMLKAATDKAINGTPSEKQAATALLAHINSVAGQVVTGKSNQSVLNPLRSDAETVAAVEAAHYSAPISGKKNAGGQSLYNQFQQIEKNLSAVGQVNNDGNPNNDISIAAIGQLEHFGTGYYTTLLTNPNKPINNVDPSVNFLKNNPAVGCSGSCTVFEAAQSITNNAAHGYNGLPSATADSLLGTTDTFGATGLKVDKNGIPIGTTVVIANNTSAPSRQTAANGTSATQPQSNGGGTGSANGTQPVPLATQVDPNSVPPLNPSGSGAVVADNSSNDTTSNNPISSFVSGLTGQSGQSSGTNAAVQAIGYALGYAIGNNGNASGAQSVQSSQGSNTTGSAFNIGSFLGSMLRSSISGGSGSAFSSGLSGGIGGIFTTLFGNFISKVISTGGGPGNLSDQASNLTNPLSSLTSVTGGGAAATSANTSASVNDSSTVSGGGGVPATNVTPIVAQLPDVSCTPQSVNANQAVTIMVAWTCYNSASANGIGFPMVNGLAHAQAQISTTTGSAWLTYGVQCSNGTARSCLVQVN